MKGADFTWNNDKMRKNDVNLYVHCSWIRWLLRVEDQSQRNKRNMTKYKVWNINGTYIYPVHPYLKKKRKK